MLLHGNAAWIELLKIFFGMVFHCMGNLLKAARTVRVLAFLRAPPSISDFPGFHVWYLCGGNFFLEEPLHPRPDLYLPPRYSD